jgi:hypothetical protein
VCVLSCNIVAGYVETLFYFLSLSACSGLSGAGYGDSLQA